MELIIIKNKFESTTRGFKVEFQTDKFSQINITYTN